MQISLSFVAYMAQKEAKHALWEDIEILAEILIERADALGNLESKGRIHDYLGYLGESLQRDTGVALNVTKHGLQAGRSYLAALETRSRAIQHSLDMLEPAIWCLRRAGRYLEAIECCRNEQAVTAAHCEFDDDIANAVAAGLEFDIAECWYREKERSGDPAALRRAIEALRNAADLQRRHYPHSWAARRCDSLAGDLERTGMCELAVPVDTTPGDVLLVHNRYDVMAADLIRAHFVELGKRCTSTGPADPRDLVDLESTYRWIIVFGSLVAVGMERFSYLFQGESEIWHLQPHLGESQATKASWWARPKVNGKGRWFLVAGYTRFATVVATDKLRREWGREEASDNRKDWAASPD